MLDRLVDALVGAVDSLKPVVFLDPTQMGVVLRAGRFNRVIGPGAHFLVPLLDETRYDVVVMRPLSLGTQSLTTSDDRKVLVCVTLTTSISDIKKALLEVDGLDSALREACQGVVGDAVLESDWATLRTVEFRKTLLHRCRLRSEEMGVKIARLQFRDLSTSLSVRLIGDNKEYQDAVNR